MAFTELYNFIYILIYERKLLNQDLQLKYKAILFEQPLDKSSVHLELIVIVDSENWQVTLNSHFKSTNLYNFRNKNKIWINDLHNLYFLFFKSTYKLY